MPHCGLFLMVQILLEYTVVSLIIIDIYLGSSTHPKIGFREVLHPIKVEFENVDF